MLVTVLLPSLCCILVEYLGALITHLSKMKNLKPTISNNLSHYRHSFSIVASYKRCHSQHHTEAHQQNPSDDQSKAAAWSGYKAFTYFPVPSVSEYGCPVSDKKGCPVKMVVEKRLYFITCSRDEASVK